MILNAIHRVGVTKIVVQTNGRKLTPRCITRCWRGWRWCEGGVLFSVVTNGLLASLGKQMLILFTKLSILQADGAVLVPRCVKLLLGNGKGVVRLANLIL